MRVEVLKTEFDPWQEVANYQSGLGSGNFGATAVFVGTMRDFNNGDVIESMLLEHYDPMTQSHLQNLVEKVVANSDIFDVLMVHRVGEISPGDPIVLVAVWSAHRAAAFEICKLLVEDLKSRAPFWKKEHLNDGSYRWVEENTAGPRH